MVNTQVFSDLKSITWKIQRYERIDLYATEKACEGIINGTLGGDGVN